MALARGRNPPSPNLPEVSHLRKMSHFAPSSCGLFVIFTWAVIAASLASLGSCYQYGDAEHITAILGESVVLNCAVSQPETPYLIQWRRQHHKIPIYIWYDGYNPHVEESYNGRASRVSMDSNFGLASLNLTSVKENDQGWYECNVFYLDRTGASDNGTWIHLDVHAPPRFVTTPEDVTYVNIGDSIILSCEAEGTPTPEIMWFRDDKAVTSSDSVGIFNDGTELRINKIRDEDIGDYLCVARNAEGRVVHDARVVIAGGAVIVNPPHNLTRLEGEKAEFPCEAKAHPANVTVVWKRENIPIDQLSWLDTRSIVHRTGTLVINPTSADDGGFFTCEVSNGIGTPQRATVYLNVEYPARVTYTPTVQYLPFRQQGIIKCHIKSNPEVQFVTWIKDKRLMDVDKESDMVKLKNGSVLITKVNQAHQGRYSCTPYNRHTTAGSSGAMEVLVREPPVFDPRPTAQYHGEVEEEVTLECGGKGSPNPTVTWRKRDGQNLPRDRSVLHGGNLTIKGLHKVDHGYYECEVKNEIMAIVAATQLLVEGTTPHPPYNITTLTKPFSIKLTWLPGYPGGREFDQKYTIWYRMIGQETWSQIEVKPAGSTSVTIHNLTPETTFEVQVQGKNKLGDGMFSEIVTATTKEYDHTLNLIPTDSLGLPYFPIIINPRGPRPEPPTNVTITPVQDNFLITWVPPEDTTTPVEYYDIEIKIDDNWKKLNDENILDETSFLVKKLRPGKTYHFRVLSKTMTSFHHSEEKEFKVPMRSKEKEITAAVVGGILFFIIAIILSVCTVKICNKRKRKMHDKELQSHIFYETAYNMVSCRVGDNRNGAEIQKGPVPLKSLLWSGISSLKNVATLVGAVFFDEGILDVTDSKPINPNFLDQTRTSSDDSKGTDFFPPNFFPYKSRVNYNSPYSSISRSTEGKFVPDHDSEEGGFASPRRQIRGLRRVERQKTPYTRQYYNIRFPRTPYARQPSSGSDEPKTDDVATGVYHVRTATASRLPTHSHRNQIAETNGRTYVYPQYISFTGSPEKGRLMIPTTSEGIASIFPANVRSSSPRPYTNEWGQLSQLASFSELSSVRQPSSVERSFPSTVISSFQRTPSTHGTPLQLSSQGDVYLSTGGQPLTVDELRDNSQTYMVDAVVHSPPHRNLIEEPSTVMVYYPSQAMYSGYNPAILRHITPQQVGLQRFIDLSHMPYTNERGYLYTPPYREHGTNLSEVSRTYANIKPKMEKPHQHIKPPAPLATSSPPRTRLHQPPFARIHSESPSLQDGNAPSKLTRTKLFQKRQIPLEGALKRSIAKRLEASSKSRSIDRPHSAPILSSLDQGDNFQVDSSVDSNKVYKKKGEHLLSSEDQSPDSSSGFGSKNTSQQQSSSQSGQSSAIGLDSTKQDSTEADDSGSHWERDLSHPYVNVLIRRPPSYERSLIRISSPQPAAYDTASGKPSKLSKDDTSNESESMSFERQKLVSPRLTSPLVIDTRQDSHQSRPSLLTTVPPALDISVDDHYEFDTVLSPTPDEVTDQWSRQRSPSDDRGLSDSEIYSSGGRRKHSDESTEARVAAMKQEFHEYRQKQAKKRRSRELESVC